MFRILVLALLCMSISSCRQAGGSKTGSTEESVLYFAKGEKVASQLPFAQEKMIQLEETDSSLIKSVTQLFCGKSEIYLFDMPQQVVFVFDYEGNYVRRLQRTGSGPEEYVLMTSISINEELNQITVVDSGERVLSYTLDTFDFVEASRFPGLSVEKVGKDKLLAFNTLPQEKEGKQYDSHLLVYSPKGEILEEHIPIDFPSGRVMYPSYRFFRYMNDLYFYPPFLPVVYKYDEEGLQKYYTLQFEGLEFPTIEFLQETEKQGKSYLKELTKNELVYSMQFFETESYILTPFNAGMKAYAGIYDKQKQQGYYVMRRELGKPTTQVDMLKVMATKDDCFVTVVTPSANADAIVENELLRKLINSSNGNPILCFLK